jgi:hypothetical protein
MQDHIRVGREYPQVDNHTTYSFGLDDQEFVVAFDTDDASAFLDLVQRLRTTEASAYTLRDTPSFTCIATSVERALSAVDGEPVPALQSLAHEPPRLRRGPRHHDHRRGAGRPLRGLLGRHARGQLAHHRLAARARRPADHALSGEVDLRRARHPKILAKDLVELHRQQTVEQFDVPVHLETTADSISGRTTSSSCTPTAAICARAR